MAESVYKVIELVGTSTESWEKAAAAAVARAGSSLRELRISTCNSATARSWRIAPRSRFPSSTRKPRTDGTLIAARSGVARPR